MIDRKTAPLVSVVIPIYKTEQYLRECVDSVRKQTYRNLEIILVDDGSPDECPAICDEYAVLDPRVRVVHKENGGSASARNAGIKAASGKWILFVDSDDVCLNTIVEELLDAAMHNKAHLAICSLAYMKEHKVKDIDPSRLTGEVEATNSHGIISRLWDSEYDNSLYTSPDCKLYDLEYFGEELRFREGIIYEDDDLFNRLYLPIYPVAIVHKALYLWRINLTSITHQKFSERNCIMLSIQEERVEAFRCIGFVSQARKTAKVFCELYIEYYCKALACGHPEWVLPYRKTFGRFQKYIGGKGMLKTHLRYCIFSLFPVFYKRYVLKM